MLITLEEYKKYLREKYRFWFRDCVVRQNDVLVFILEPGLTDEQVQKEQEKGWDSNLRFKGLLIFIRSKEVGKQWGAGYMNGWQAMELGAAKKPLPQAIMIERLSTYPSLDKKCFVTGSGPAYEDKPLISMGPEDNGQNSNFLRGHLGRLKTLDGFLYACGGGRALGKRLDKGQWQSFSQYFPLDDDSDEDTGFDDFDGWGENDIYCVGGEGDVWHFDGQTARQIAFPSNTPLSAVCCGGDGNVYIAGLDGIFMGREDRWQKIGSINSSLPIKDMLWYEDKVWCTNEYGLWTIENGRVASADVPDDIAVCAGNLSANDGVLLLAGFYGAAFKENGEWQVIMHFDVMDALLEISEKESDNNQ